MQADGKRPPAERRNYKHAVDGLVRMVRSDGVGSLMGGWQPNLARAMLMTAGQLSSYDFFKQQVLAAGMKDGTGAHLTASTLAGLVACTICNPVDVVKTRIMNSEPGAQRISPFETFSRVVKQEGIRGMYKGFLPAYARLGYVLILFSFLFLTFGLSFLSLAC
jgi:dicarboxylate transporter 10